MEDKKKCGSHGDHKSHLKIVRFIYMSNGQHLCTLKCVKCGTEFEGIMEKVKQ